MISVCRRRSVGSKRWWESSVGSVCSVRERTTQELSSALSLTVSAFYFSQKNTEEQISQRPTETLSQPISQNVTATFSLNVLWYLYAEGVLWVRNVGGKVLLNLWVLWEIKLPCESHRPYLIEWVRTFSHRFTQMNRTHKGQKDSGPSPDPSPEGKGSDHRDTPMGWM